jgi:uncharacterized membrane protein
MRIAPAATRSLNCHIRIEEVERGTDRRPLFPWWSFKKWRLLAQSVHLYYKHLAIEIQRNQMKQSALIYLATLIIAFPLDFIFLQTWGKLFDANVRKLILDGPEPAILFYVIYVACTVSFVNGATPDDWTANASRGALLGLCFFVAFELGSIALLKHWKWDITLLPDIIWGAALTALAASVGGLFAGWILTEI